MKISKILCGALLGCVVGSAFGVPTPEDRKKFCDQHPDKFVWVEKTKACIPINPCKASDISVRSYCISGADIINFTSDKVYERYIKNVLGVDIVEHKVFDESTEQYIYHAYKLTDGGYVVFSSFLDGDAEALNQIRAGCFAYGKKYRTFDFDAKLGLCEDMESETQCTDIADFVMLIRETFCRGILQADNSCLIRCEKVDESDKKSGPGGGNL